MNFMFSWQEQYLAALTRGILFLPLHLMIKFISSHHRVISSMYISSHIHVTHETCTKQILDVSFFMLNNAPIHCVLRNNYLCTSKKSNCVMAMVYSCTSKKYVYVFLLIFFLLQCQVGCVMLKRLMVATFYLTSGKDALVSLFLTCTATRNSVDQNAQAVISIWQVWVANNKNVSI